MSRGFEPRADREVFTLPLTIAQADIDENGHVNNVVYVRWLQNAGTAHWNARFTTAERAPWGWVAIRHEVDYFRALKLGEATTARTWVGDAAGAKFDRFVQIEGPDGLCAQGRTTWCLVKAETMRPTRIPPEMAARLSASRA